MDSHPSEKEPILGILIFAIIDIILAFVIPNLLGIQNVIIYSSITVLLGDVTWEVVIFLGLASIETIIYLIKKYLQTEK